PTPRRVDVNVHNAELTAEALAIDDRPGRPETGCHRGFLKNTHPNISGDERFTLHLGRLNRRNPLVPVDPLSVRERALEVITVHALKESAIAQKDGTRSFSLKADNLLPLLFGIPELGLANTSLDAPAPPGILGLPRRDKEQPDCQCHHTPNSVHVKSASLK